MMYRMSIEDQIPKLTPQDEPSVAVWRALGREFGLNHLLGYCITLGLAIIGLSVSFGGWIITQTNNQDKSNVVSQMQITAIKSDVSDLKASVNTLSSNYGSMKGDVHDQGKDISDMKSYMKDMRDQIQSWSRVKGN